MNDRNEQALRDLARRYVEEQGKRLLDERARVERDGPAAPPTLKKRVNARLNAPRRRRVAAVAGLLAACIALFILAPLSVQRSPGDGIGTEDAAGVDLPGDEAADAAPDAEPEPQEAAPEAPDASDGEPERIELQLDLPVHFSVVDIDQDSGRTVYHIDHEQLDNVVLAVQARAEPLDTRGMDYLPVNGVDAWARSGPDYQLLTFELEDVVYVLTCRYELETLVELAGYIIPDGR